MSDTCEMVGRVLAESRIGLAEVGRMVAVDGGRPVHPATITRWVTRGVLAGGGRRVKLEAVKVGSRLVSSREAVARFVAATTAAPEAAPAPRSPAERRKAADRAGAELDALLGPAGGTGGAA